MTEKRRNITIDLARGMAHTLVAKRNNCSLNYVQAISQELKLNKRSRASEITEADKVRIKQMAATHPIEKIKRDVPHISRPEIKKIICEDSNGIIMKDPSKTVIIGMTRHSESEKETVKDLIARGFYGDEIFRMTNIYSSTINGWKHAWMRDPQVRAEIISKHKEYIKNGGAVRLLRKVDPSELED